jgi:hypothetical protein
MDKEALLQEFLRTKGRQSPPEGYSDELVERLRERLRDERRERPAFSVSRWLAALAEVLRRPAVAWPVGFAAAAFAAGYFLRSDPPATTPGGGVVVEPAAVRQGGGAVRSGAVAIPVGFGSEEAAPVPVDQSGPEGVPPSDVPGKRRTVTQPEHR